MKTLVYAASLVVAFSMPALAQDAEGCKDHPFFNRMPNFVIADCRQNFDKLEYYTSSDGATATKEGELTVVSYVFPEDQGLKVPSQLQIIRNWENAFTKLGGKRVFVDEQYASYSLQKGSKSYVLSVQMSNGRIDHQLCVLEVGLMTQEVTTNELLDALNKDGFVAVNILFETGKSAIQQESLPLVDRIRDLLKGDQTLRLSIEGHTDDVGEAASNKKLSNDRAKAVMDALIAAGIERTRLSCVGWGQEKPVADNRTEEGRARNRRVELVKQAR